MMLAIFTDSQGQQTRMDLPRRGIRLISFVYPRGAQRPNHDKWPACSVLMVGSTGEFLTVPPGGKLEIRAV